MTKKQNKPMTKDEIKKAVKESPIYRIDVPLRSYNPVNAPSKFTLKYWKYRYMDSSHADKTLLVNMELLNGFHKLFLVMESDGGFRYKKKKYLFDNVSKYFVIDAKLWCYDFHEDFVLPIKRIIPISDIKKAIELSGYTQVENATNPKTLERFLKAKIAEGIMKGQQIDEWFKKMSLLLLVIALTSIIHLCLFLFKTGMLQSIKIPGFK